MARNRGRRGLSGLRTDGPSHCHCHCRIHTMITLTVSGVPVAAVAGGGIRLSRIRGGDERVLSQGEIQQISPSDDRPKKLVKEVE